MKQQEVNRVEQPKPQPRPEPKVETKFEPKQPEPPKPIAVQPAQPPQQTKPFESQNPVQQINKPFEPVQQQQQYQATTTQNHFQSNQSFDATDFSHSTRQQQQHQEVFQQQTSIKSHQQQKFESHSTNFASHSSSERKEHHELKHHELNMQVKSGGILRDQQQQLNDQEVEDYIGSLRPTTTGAVIRSPQPGDGIFTSAPSMESQQNNELFSQSQLKKTQREGVFGGIAGDHNSLATDAEEYERHTVRNLVQHFSKTKTGDIPLQYLPQQSMQNTGNAPPLSYLKEQAKSKDFSYKEKTETTTSSSEHSNNVTNGKVAKKGSKDYIEDPEVRLGLFQRRGSLKDYLMMDEEKQKQESLPSIQDPSAILQGCKPFVSPDRPPSRTSLRAATNSPPITNNPLYYKNSKLVSPRPFGKQHQSFTSSSTTTTPNKPNLPRPISRQQQHTSTTPETFIQPSPPTHHSQAQDITQQCIETNTKTNSTQQLTYDQVNVLNQELQHIEQHQQQMQQQHILKEERQEQRKHIEIKKLQQQEEQRQLAEMQRLMREEEARQQQEEEEEEAKRKIAADRFQEEQRMRKKQQEEEQRQLAEMQRLRREEEARQQQEEEAERKIAADKLRKEEARKKQEEHRIALQKLKEEEDRKKQMKAQEEEKKKQMKAQEEERKKLALEKQKQEQLRIEQEKQRILEQQRIIQEEQKRIEAERIRMEVEQKRLEEEQRQIEEFRLRMERAKSSPEEMYYTTEVKVVASPYPSPLTIPNQSPKTVASSTTKDTSPEYYYSSQVVSVTSTPYQSPLTVPSLRQMNESPFQKRSSYHEESYQASDYSQQQQTFLQQQRPVSMYEASNLQSHSMQSHTFQSHMQTTNNTTNNNNKTTIPMKYSLQPLGGRADLTVRPDMQDDSSSSPDSVSSFRPL